MRTRKTRKRININARLQLFAQLIFILFIIITGILISSSSFYVGMIESLLSIKMRDSIEAAQQLDLNSTTAVDSINKIEYNNRIILEIYKEDSPGSKKYTKCIYSKYAQNIFCDNEGFQTIRSNPMVDYINATYTKLKSYPDGTEIGITDNENRRYRYFCMSMTSEDNSILYVSAIKYIEIEAQAQSVSLACSILCIVIFAAASISIYLFLTKILNPLKIIIDKTGEMATSQDKTLRIPTRQLLFINEIDQAINNVNTLYESLMITQSELAEKTDFLMCQLKEKNDELKVREEFLANTSHELKTPIAIIQGYAEGMQYIYDDAIAMDEYCETIIGECVRMKNLVVDMISLSDINRNFEDLHYTSFSITDFIRERLQMHEMIFMKNNIHVKNLIKDEIYGNADIAKLSYVINNLLSNAVSYIGKERIIRLRYEDVGLSYRIFVFNSGNEMKQETLQKLWDSFYRTDLSRNRSDGHFGLGLSIVKAVQDAHSQQCGVDNADGGVEFWFDIAKQ